MQTLWFGFIAKARAHLKLVRRDIKWLSVHHMVLAIASSFLTCAVVTGHFLWATQLPFVAELSSVHAGHSIDEPVAVQLEQVVQKEFEATIWPEVEGEWVTKQDILGVKEIVFVPRDSFAASAHYTVKITKLKRVTGQPLPDLYFSFTTEEAPLIKTVVPENGAMHVAVDTKIRVVLERPNHALRALRPVLEPAMELTALPTEEDETIFSWQPMQQLKQGQTYILHIFDDKTLTPLTPIMDTQFTVVAEPQITSATNKDHFYPGETIDVTFDQPMRQDQPGFTCGCEGTGTWVSNTHYQLTPQNITPGQTYKYTVPAGLTSEQGGKREANAEYAVQTPGHVVASINGLGRSAATNASITIHFDQAVQRASAEARFSMSPQVGGSFRWTNDTTLVYAPNGLDTQTDYRASMAPGVQPARFGLESVSTFSMSFATAPPVVKLNVPLYRQQYPSSCEAAALRMALAYRGIQDNDWNIVHRMGHNGRALDKATNSWDDPFQMYVGDVRGYQSNLTAYGAYGPPIAAAANSYGRNASVHYGVSANFIADQIHAGNPVVIIGTSNGSATVYLSWNGPNGLVHAWYGEHARTVVGVTGKPGAPISFLVHDPLSSSPLTWSPARLIDDINAIPQLPSQAIVIY